MHCASFPASTGAYFRNERQVAFHTIIDQCRLKLTGQGVPPGNYFSGGAGSFFSGKQEETRDRQGRCNEFQLAFEHGVILILF